MSLFAYALRPHVQGLGFAGCGSPALEIKSDLTASRIASRPRGLQSRAGSLRGNLHIRSLWVRSTSASRARCPNAPATW